MYILAQLDASWSAAEWSACMLYYPGSRLGLVSRLEGPVSRSQSGDVGTTTLAPGTVPRGTAAFSAMVIDGGPKWNSGLQCCSHQLSTL